MLHPPRDTDNDTAFDGSSPLIELSGQGEHVGRLVRCFSAAVDNLCAVNTVPGRSPAEPKAFLRAGGGYQEPWTRDAAINAWQAASVVSPEVARDTMLMVCERRADGLLLAQDDQWWDQIIWVPAAWRHFLVTGDSEFLREAYGIGVRSIRLLTDARFAPRWGLYQGPAAMEDGISAYPDSVVSPEHRLDSFVLDHRASLGLMCLSTNLVYLEAFSSLEAMSRELGVDEPSHRQQRDALAAAIERWLWSPGLDSYGYFIQPHDSDDGAAPPGLDLHQETLGLAFAVLFGAAPDERAARIVRQAHREPMGVVNVWPHLQDFDATHPGRHNVLCWPMVMGYWAQAAARTGDVASFATDVGHLVDLVAGSGYRFFETYEAQAGTPHGGWQAGRLWRSEPDQTWSATALIGAVLYGLFGLELTPEGLCLNPTVPPGFAPVTVRNLQYRGSVLDIELTGHGAQVVEVILDGRRLSASEPVHLPATLVGRHQITVHCTSPATPTTEPTCDVPEDNHDRS